MTERRERLYKDLQTSTGCGNRSAAIDRAVRHWLDTVGGPGHPPGDLEELLEAAADRPVGLERVVRILEDSEVDLSYRPAEVDLEGDN